jgi:outer membrane protein assembly factor BamB
VGRVRIGSGLLAAAACAAALAGCSGLTSSARGPGANGSPASGSGPAASATLRTATRPSATPPSATARTATLSAPWPEREVLPESLSFADFFQAYDPATGTLYALLPKQPNDAVGPRVLTAVDVRTGATRRGGTYETSELTLADGYLWVYHNAGQRTQVDEVAAGTLATVRAILLPSSLGPFEAGPAVAGAPDGSAWVGTRQTLWRVSLRTGAVLTKVTLPAGLALATMAADPDGDYFYVAAAHEVGGGAVEGAVILEYSESTGALLATADGTPISYSIAGATLTAVPGGVWVSFRTGMLGANVLLSGHGLAVIAAPDLPAARLGAYYFAMSSTATYGGGTLWVTATDDGLVACLNPATGKVIAQETFSSFSTARPDELLTADPATRELYGTVIAGTFAALVSITPPAACWG